MKKNVLLFSLLLLISCGNEVIQSNCFVGITMNETVYLTNAEYINLEVPGGNAITTLGGRTILIIRQGNTTYKAFDLQCPEGGCNTPMAFDDLFLTCSCDNKRYSSINGAPVDENGAIINDGSCFALEYNVSKTSATTLQITR